MPGIQVGLGDGEVAGNHIHKGVAKQYRNRVGAATFARLYAITHLEAANVTLHEVEIKKDPRVRVLGKTCRGGGISEVPLVGRTIEKKRPPGKGLEGKTCRGGGI